MVDLRCLENLWQRPLASPQTSAQMCILRPAPPFNHYGIPERWMTISKPPFLCHPLSVHITFMMIRSSLRTIPRGLKCSNGSTTVGRRWASTPAAFKWEDPLASATLFTEDELAIEETAKAYCQERMLPRVLGLSFLFSISAYPFAETSVSRGLP
jgi:hypothetical protein